MASPNREDRDRVARIVMAAVESRNGRFLKKVDTSQPSGAVSWLPVEESVAIQKIKQVRI